VTLLIRHYPAAINLFPSFRTANTWHHTTTHGTVYSLTAQCRYHTELRPDITTALSHNIKSVRFSTNRTQATITVTLLTVQTTCQYPVLTFRRTSPCTPCFTWTVWPTCSYGTDWRVSVSTGHAIGRDTVRTLHIKASRCNAVDSHHQPGGWNTASQPG